MFKGPELWFDNKNNIPEVSREAPPKTERKYKRALLWLIVAAPIGGHRLYLWQLKKAFLVCILYSLGVLTVLTVMTQFSFSEKHINLTAHWGPIFLIILFELPRLKGLVEQANLEHVLKDSGENNGA